MSKVSNNKLLPRRQIDSADKERTSMIQSGISQVLILRSSDESV